MSKTVDRLNPVVANLAISVTRHEELSAGAAIGRTVGQIVDERIESAQRSGETVDRLELSFADR